MLRAHIGGDADVVGRAREQFAEPPALAALGSLTQAAFVVAARRMFAPTWTRSDVIQYVAMIRTIFPDQPDLLNPLAAENELRIALGDSVPAWPDDAARSTVVAILLPALGQTLELDDAGIDELLSQARELADLG